MKKIFLISEKGDFLHHKDLLNIESIQKRQHLKNTIIKAFESKFPDKKMLEPQRLEQNLDAYLHNSEFAFSGNVVDFYIYSGLLSSDFAENIILSVDYNSLDNAILLTPKIPEPKPIPPTSQTQKPKSSDGKKYLALTFDDGPHGVYTPQLLDTLKAKNVRATFYML